MPSKKAMGIRNAHYAVYNEELGTFDAPKRIPDLETIAVSETYAEGSNYADNLRNIYIKEMVEAEISMEFSNLSRKTEAELTGQAFANGEIEYKTDATAKTVALLFEKTYSDGSIDKIVYYNCKLTKDSENGETKTDAFNFTGDSLSGQAIPLTNATVKGVLKYVMSSADLPPDTNQGTNDEAYKVNSRYIHFFDRVQYKGVEDTQATPRP